MPNETLQVGQHSVELVRSTRRKRISLEITATGIKLRSPMRTSLRVLREFAHSKKAWLDKHHRSLPEALPPLRLNDGLELNVFEQDIVVRYDYSRAGKATVDRELAEKKRAREETFQQTEHLDADDFTEGVNWYWKDRPKFNYCWHRHGPKDDTLYGFIPTDAM